MVMSDADHKAIQRMNELLDAMLPADDFVPAIEARRIYEYLMDQDSGDFELLNDFLTAMAESLLTKLIGERRRSIRNSYLRGEPARRFGAAAHSGNPAALNPYLSISYVVDGGVQKSLGSLTANDLRFVSDRYEKNGNRELVLAEFHRQLAVKVEAVGPDAIVRDSVPRTEYDRLVASLGVADHLPPPTVPTV